MRPVSARHPRRVSLPRSRGFLLARRRRPGHLVREGRRAARRDPPPPRAAAGCPRSPRPDSRPGRRGGIGGACATARAGHPLAPAGASRSARTRLPLSRGLRLYQDPLPPRRSRCGPVRDEGGLPRLRRAAHRSRPARARFPARDTREPRRSLTPPAPPTPSTGRGLPARGPRPVGRLTDRGSTSRAASARLNKRFDASERRRFATQSLSGERAAFLLSRCTVGIGPGDPLDRDALFLAHPIAFPHGARDSSTKWSLVPPAVTRGIVDPESWLDASRVAVGPVRWVTDTGRGRYC